MSTVFPVDLVALLECGYVRWTGSAHAEIKDADTLVLMGFLEWTSRGCEARARRIRELEIRLGFRRPDEIPPDMTAGEEHTLP